MRLLLDTSIVIWLMTNPQRAARQGPALRSDDNELAVSAVCAWEMSIKYALGRLPLPEPPARYVPGAVAVLGATPIPVTHEHALGVAELPPIHGDLFDRLLVAQAIALDATLVTGDAILADYPCETLLV